MNKTFKTNSQIVEIEATATEVINTKVVFWSHDKGTARLKFQLKKEGAVYPLTEGTIVPICLLFKSNSAADGVGRHIYNATIDDAVNGLISFILPDNILGYQGIVDGSIYVDMPNKQSLDTAGRFTFNIRRSPIDDMVPELEDYYYAGFNAVDQRIKDTLTKIETIETDFIKEMNAMQSKLNKFESDSKLQMDNIQQQITDKELYTKKESDDKFVPQTQTATATQPGILKVVNDLVTTDPLSALSAEQGKLLDEKLTIITQGNIEATKKPSEFNDGITISQGHKAQGFPQDYNTIITYKLNLNRVTQWLFPKDLNMNGYQIYLRGVSVQDAWSEWQPMILGKDVINDLVSSDINKPLSAAMGKQLKESMVTTADNQTIGGIKNFTSIPKVNGVDLIEDTGWKTLPITGAASQPGSTTDGNYIPKYRIKNGFLMLRGAVKINAGKTGMFTTLSGIVPITWNRLAFKQPLMTDEVNASATVYAHENGELQLVSRTTGNQDVWLTGIQIPL